MKKRLIALIVLAVLIGSMGFASAAQFCGSNKVCVTDYSQCNTNNGILPAEVSICQNSLPQLGQAAASAPILSQAELDAQCSARLTAGFQSSYTGDVQVTLSGQVDPNTKECTVAYVNKIQFDTKGAKITGTKTFVIPITKDQSIKISLPSGASAVYDNGALKIISPGPFAYEGRGFAPSSSGDYFVFTNGKVTYYSENYGFGLRFSNWLAQIKKSIFKQGDGGYDYVAKAEPVSNEKVAGGTGTEISTGTTAEPLPTGNGPKPVSGETAPPTQTSEQIAAAAAAEKARRAQCSSSYDYTVDPALAAAYQNCINQK